MNLDLDELLATARSAVAIGYKLLGNAAAGTVQKKSDRDYVTELDMRIQTEIAHYLAHETPSIGFFGEEGSKSDVSDGNVWTLDPIDGTSNFIHGLPLCAVSLALTNRGNPIVAVVAAPFLGLEYYAVANGGAFSNENRIAASNTKTLDKAIVSIGDYAVGPGADEKNRRRIALTNALAANVERVRMFGSAALDLVWVAEGRTDGCVILSNKPWDTAAGVLIAREAGAIVTDLIGMRHSQDSNETIAVAGPIADRVLELVRQTQPAD